MFQGLFLKLHQFLHLFNKPGLNIGLLKERFYAGSLSQGLVHDKLPFARRLDQQLHQFIQRFIIKVLGKAEPIAAVFQRANRFLEGLLIILANAHDLAYGVHLCAQLIFRALKLLKGPSCKFHYYIVTPWRIFVQGPLSPVWDFVQRHAPCQHGGNKRDGKTRGLGSQG